MPLEISESGLGGNQDSGNGWCSGNGVNGDCLFMQYAHPMGSEPYHKTSGSGYSLANMIRWKVAAHTIE